MPRIFSPFVSEEVLIMERIYGIPVNDVHALEAAGVSLPQLSEIGATIFLSQVFRDNFFHADMHPGNIFVDVTNPKAPKYIALDCAIAGELHPRDHRLLTRQLLSLFKQDYLRLAKLMISGGWVPADTHRLDLAKALEEVCSPILSKPLAEIDFGPLLASLFQTARAFDLQALPQFVLLEKTLLHVEGLGRQLDPHLDIWTLGQPLLTRWLRASALAPDKALGAQRRVSHLVETLPEALEDWYDQYTGLQAGPAQANGQRLKVIEKQLIRTLNFQTRIKQFLTLGGIGFIIWGYYQWQTPIPIAVLTPWTLAWLSIVWPSQVNQNNE